VRSSSERRLEVSRETVWVALNEPDVLRRCLPGCENVERVSDVEFAIGARLPRATDGGAFAGALRLGDVDPPAGFRFTAEVRNRHNRLLAATGRIDLAAAGGATLLRFELTLSGDALPRGAPKPGNGAAALLAEAFSRRFERALADRQGEPGQPVAAPRVPAATLAEQPRPGLRPVVWVPALMLAVALILYSSS
jgi:carbon monoxide dehydrogenase subunit G